MPTYIESGLHVHLPDGDSFRFEDCAAYRRLSGWSLKEMDFGWWDGDRQILWLMELKDYSRLTPRERLPEPLFDNLLNKATDSLLMLSAAWLQSNQGKTLRPCLPSSCGQLPRRIKLVFVIKLHQTPIIADLGPLGVRLKNRLRGRVALFDLDVKDVAIADHNTAIKLGLPLSIGKSR
jgi:hypothetical protein